MRIGILGAGGIANTMAGTLDMMIDRARGSMADDSAAGAAGSDGTPPEACDIVCEAIAARDLSRAEAFAREYGFNKAYGSYDELLSDPDVDLVYIALPHSHHYEWTIKALNSGKHVLCEKAFAVNEKQAREMIELAEHKGLLLTEAIWTRYTPSRKIIHDLVMSGEIGKIWTISANLGYKIDMNERLVKPELAGGALLDLTIYPLNFTSMLLGDDIGQLACSCSMTETGVDGQDSVTLTYKDGEVAHLFTTIYTLTDRRGMIYGDDGFIEVDNINNPLSVRVYSNDRHPGPKLLKEIKMPEQLTGYEYEVEACARAIKEGMTECPEMPHSETLVMMRLMDSIRGKFGIKYPCE